MPFLLILKPFWPLIWRAVAGVLVVLFVWWAWAHFVADPYREQGRAEEHVKTVAAEKRAADAEAANAKLGADLIKLKADYQEQGTQVAALVAQSDASKKAVKNALAALKKQEVAAKNEIEKLKIIALKPPAVTKEADCEDADKLIDLIYADRLRS